MALLPLSYIIFSQLSVQGSALDDIHFQDTIWLGLALFILIHVLGILFFFLGPKMEPIYAYTVARDVLNGRTKSILNHYTTYGVISAITAIFSIAFMLSRKKKDRINILAILTLMVALMGGVFSSSRNFFWTLGVGCAVVSLQYIRSRKAVLVATSAMIGLIIIFHVVTIYVPAIGNRFDPYLPYLQQLRYGEPQIGHTPGSDLEGTGFEQRIKIWKTAISLWRHNPIIGIGPGVFRLKNTMSSDLNVHNVFLQMLTEGGIVGLIFFLVLIGRIIHRSWNHPSFPVFIAILAALLFDNFLDYSIPFVLCTTYMLAALDDYSGMEGRLS
ncbi:MAG: O-antigen ligase family protein [Desulfobacteraceae bacterium]|nr:O-antigen ligase family protein [Desulfobacteraceae bacterium]